MERFIIAKLEEIVKTENLLTSPEDRWTYAYDATEEAHLPDAVVFPGSADEISRILKLANEHRFPVTPRGAGTGRSGGAVPVQGGVVLVLTRLSRILEISRRDMVAVVEPGVILGRLKAAAEAEGLYYPPDPSSADFCTIGGNVAECAGGAVAVQYGVTRDYVLGLEVVLPTGEIIEAGTRTMKGVVGYDLTRLFLGSEGTLGVMSRIVLRLTAKPAARQTLAASFDTLAAAAETVTRILTSGLAPTALEFMDHVTLGCVRELLPFEVLPGTGGPPGPQGPDAGRSGAVVAGPQGHLPGALEGEAPEGERGRGGAPGSHPRLNQRPGSNLPAPGPDYSLLRPRRGREYPRQRAL
jgi:glycolate oxidase